MQPTKLNGNYAEPSAPCSIEQVEELLDKSYVRKGSTDAMLKKLKAAIDGLKRE